MKFELSKNWHEKRQCHVFTASLADKVSKDEFKRLAYLSRKFGGWYFRKYGPTPGGFHFLNKSDRDQFLAEVQ